MCSSKKHPYLPQRIGVSEIPSVTPLEIFFLVLDNPFLEVHNVVVFVVVVVVNGCCWFWGTLPIMTATLTFLSDVFHTVELSISYVWHMHSHFE